MHNETMNVWTHGVGSLLFIFFICHLAVHFTAVSPLPPFTAGSGSLLAVSSPQGANVAALLSGPPLARMQYMHGGTHTRVALVTHVLGAGDGATGAPPVHSYLPSLHSLQSRLQQSQRFLADSSAAISSKLQALDDSLRDLSHSLLDLRSNVTSEALSRVRRFNHALHTHATAFADAGHEHANAAGAQLARLGRRVTRAIDDLLSAAASGVSTFQEATRKPNVVPLWPLFVFLASAMLCLAFSAGFHLFSCLSEEWWAVLAPLDYVGISLLIAGSSVPIIVYGFACHPWWQAVHVSGIFAVNSMCVVTNLLPRFRTAEYRLIRASLFVAAGVYGIMPVTHLLLAHAGHPFFWWLFKQLATMGAMYIFGAVLYAARVPERFTPGRFDMFVRCLALSVWCGGVPRCRVRSVPHALFVVCLCVQPCAVFVPPNLSCTCRRCSCVALQHSDGAVRLSVAQQLRSRMTFIRAQKRNTCGFCRSWCLFLFVHRPNDCRKHDSNDHSNTHASTTPQQQQQQRHSPHWAAPTPQNAATRLHQTTPPTARPST